MISGAVRRAAHLSSAFHYYILRSSSLRRKGRHGSLYHMVFNTSYYTATVDDSSRLIDLRSDTVTLPSEEMRQAMANAVLGDDVYGEDKTINSLEERCARLFDKEAALFVVSGTMGNLLAIMTHCQRGDEIIVGKTNHIHRWEQGNYAQIAGVSATTLPVNADGTMNLDEIEEAIRVDDCHMPRTSLICLENTHNYAGGLVLPLDYMRAVRELATRRNVRVHIDGARIYNAAVALGVKVSNIAQYGDSIMMCFSKGLGAPVGSVLVGSKKFIELARRRRKALGGGWRQAGVLAAAAHIALDRAEETVKQDHLNACKLARGFNEMTPESLKDDLQVVESGITNMILLKCSKKIPPVEVKNFFHSHGVLVMPFDDTRVRIVTNWGIKADDVEKVLSVYKAFVESLSS
ncbi:unnamed protein product [Cylicocyclus nassatus]|uniref:Aromatic amino acid beta-eliminating lyase/threonine aldolase domain-containing protein n=1 Tax=Cylicocyclus nassatus TaxID=53992 RepID=A0AA36MAG8_CYLNA|nr:unnamed protein product [Cylicocyclus nassatus]